MPSGLTRAAAPHPFSRVPRWAWIAFLTPVIVWSGWYLTTNYRDAVARHVADAKAWTIQGPPCPPSDVQRFLGIHHKPPQRFDFEGVAFFRRTGHVKCAMIRDKGGLGGRLHAVCQFTSPGDLMVRMPTGDVYFQPGPGQPATISTAGEVARCVMASRYTL